MSVRDEIYQKLQAAFTPDRLEVINESHKHSGHAGDDGSGESHFRVLIRASGFEGMNRITRHRAVHGALGKEMMTSIHALALDIDS